MAQLTKGITFEWGAAGDSDAAPGSWTKIPDITSIPTLIGAPSSHDVTTIYSEMKEYLEGLPDNGGTLGFSALFTPALFTVVDAIQTAQETADPYFRVALPKPLNKAYTFRSTLAIPANDEWQPDNPILGTLNITPTSSITFDNYTPGAGA